MCPRGKERAIGCALGVCCLWECLALLSGLLIAAGLGMLLLLSLLLLAQLIAVSGRIS